MVLVKAWNASMTESEIFKSDTIPQRYLTYFSKTIEPKFCRVATVDGKKRPHVAAFRFAYDDRRIYFSSFTNRYTVRNIRLNPNVSVIVDRNDEHPTSYCTMRGNATILQEGHDFDYAFGLAHTTNPGLDALLARFHRGEYNDGGEFVMVAVSVEQIFSRMV